MADAQNRKQWQMGAVFTVAIANSFRSSQSALKIYDFPYCGELKTELRQATTAECKAFAQSWNEKLF